MKTVDLCVDASPVMGVVQFMFEVIHALRFFISVDPKSPKILQSGFDKVNVELMESLRFLYFMPSGEHKEYFQLANGSAKIYPEEAPKNGFSIKVWQITQNIRQCVIVIDDPNNEH